MNPAIIRAINAFEDFPTDEPIGWAIYVLMFVGIFVSPLIVYMGARQLQQGYRMYVNDPVDAAAVADEEGIVEVEGVARELDETTSTQYTNEPALAHTYRRERKQESTDDDGNTTTNWTQVSKGSGSVPFLVEDDTGTVVVDPADASLSLSETQIDKRGRRIDTSNRSRDDRREYEGSIAPGDEVYVYGQVRTAAAEGDAPGDEEVYIGDGDEVSRFVVSDGSELRTVVRYIGAGMFLMPMGVAMTLISLVAFLGVTEAMFGLPFVSVLPALF